MKDYLELTPELLVQQSQEMMTLKAQYETLFENLLKDLQGMNASWSPNLSNNFAGKEAFSKALGTGVRGFSLAEIEILRDGLGKPYINLYGKAKNTFGAMGGKNIHISISDTDNISTAVVIIEG